MAGPERIELPPSVSKTEMISISPKPDVVLSTRIELVFRPYQGRVMPLYYESNWSGYRINLEQHVEYMKLLLDHHTVAQKAF